MTRRKELEKLLWETRNNKTAHEDFVFSLIQIILDLEDRLDNTNEGFGDWGDI